LHKGPASINLVGEWEGFSPFKPVSTDEYGLLSDRYPNDEIPPTPKVLALECADEMAQGHRGNQEALKARGLELVRPLAREAPSSQRREIGLWNPFKTAMKPVKEWLAEVSEAIIQPTTDTMSAERTRIAPGLPGSQARDEAVRMSKQRESE
jgi:hypothetical protein